MMNELIITNGDSAVEVIRAAGVEADILPWRDLLHEGPVPAGLDLQALSRVRADYIAGQGWGDADSIRHSFVQRDQQLRSFGSYKKLTLCFEHDLYDQLQLLQILDYLAGINWGNTSVAIIVNDDYLGCLEPEQVLPLLARSEQVTEQQLSLAQRAWQAFRAAEPSEWQELLVADCSAIAYLRPAVLRMLEEYPSAENGLSRSAQQALALVAAGECDAGKLFSASQQQEQAHFMGDWSFFRLLQQMCNSQPPLLCLSGAEDLSMPLPPAHRLAITDSGRAVLAGSSSAFVEMHWIGGVKITADRCWCWDAGWQQLIVQSLG